ncbi:hypothetical protein BGZ83_005753 [Gryganskiella cystojenkinii]|nr:hypothetical protein BGZ83_005753 [Gryganskiella cystojenkinii]
MPAFFKLALIATLAAMVSAAPIDTAAVRHTSASLIPLADQDLTISAASKVSTDSSSSSSGTFSGRGTWFTDTVGSCGTPFDTNDMIVAMNAAQMGGTSQCGREVRITANGKTVQGRVVDTCPSQFCSSGALDLSQAVFKKLAPLAQGVVQLKWEFVN